MCFLKNTMIYRPKISLAARNALVYFVLFIVAIGLSSWLLISYSYREVLNITENQLAHTSGIVHTKFESYFKKVETDINQLAKSPMLGRYASNPDSVNLSFLTEEYASFLSAKPSYFQIRLISVSDFGAELIKIERQGLNILKTPKNQLQNKRERDYFKELSNLPVDSLYISKINLNREFGKVSEPHIPTARMGKKMTGGTLRDFIIIINIDLGALFNDLEKSIQEKDDLRIVNQDGHYILHPNDDLAFTFDFDKAGGYDTEFTVPIEHMTEIPQLDLSETEVNRFTKLKYLRNDYHLYTVLSANKKDVLASFYQWRRLALIVSVSVGFIFLTVAFLYMRKQVRELKSITRKMVDFSTQIGPKKLPIERNDEIGDLAREFEIMSSKIFENQTIIEKSREEAEQAHKEKLEFLENMSHEIRNPLQSILGAVDILNNNQQLPHQASFIESIKFSSKQLQSLANDILDFNKITAQSIELQPQWHDLDEFCNDVYNSAKYLANSKQINLLYQNLLPQKHQLVLFDAARLYQILNNLITNALKFTAVKGEVRFIIKKNESNHQYQFMIKDNGRGLSETQKQRILDRHYASGQNAGAGLGLPIVINLLSLYKSELNITSEVSVGSQFSFSLNLASKAATQHPTVSDTHIMAEEGCRLLIVEDDPQIIKWYQHVLSQHTLKFLTHPSQMTQVEGQIFDHIISDYHFGRTTLDLATIDTVFKPTLKSRGHLIIVSGQDLNITGPGIKVLKKPVDKHDLLAAIRPFGDYPNFTSIENDYDHQTNLIKNVVQLMITEWQKDQQLIEDSLSLDDLEKFKAVRHKLITSVRRLNLTDFEALLDKTESQFYQLDLPAHQSLINQSFEKYLQAMQDYLKAMMD